MKKLLIASAVVAAVVLSACGGKEKKDEAGRVAKGKVYYGGVFRMNEEEDFRNLFPHNITEAVSMRIALNVYEGLVKMNVNDLSIIPSIAEKWEVSEDAKTFTFKLRKGVKFQDNECFPDGKGREVKASDFKYCFERLCTADPNNQGFFIFQDRVVGANEYYASTQKKAPLPGGVSGIKVVDDYTLQINLTTPNSGFINLLSTQYAWVFPKEAWEKYGVDMRTKAVGTGPFFVKEVKEGEVVILARNPEYWGVDEFGNQLPYLDIVKVSFIKEKKSELLEFKKGNLEMVYRLPVEMITDILADFDEAKKGGNQPFDLQEMPSMAVQFYGFQTKVKPFDNKLVRQAFNYAIDRQRIVNFVLQGDGVVADKGFVPPVFKKYPYDNVKGYSFDADKAKKLLAQAGYPNGKGFPEVTLYLNSGGQRNPKVAEAIANQLKENLNITIKQEILPFAQHLENYETGKALLFRSAWVADYPDPASFLTFFNGQNVPASLSERAYQNPCRYQSADFDSTLAQALAETDEAKRFELFAKADQLAIEDAPYMPIYYETNTRLIQLYVRNCPQNALEYRDLARTFMVPKDKVGPVELQKPDTTVSEEDIQNNQ